MAGFAWTLRTGKVTPLHRAAVPLAAPGVLFGESAFETLRVRAATVFQLHRHVERLQRTMRELGWGIPPSREDIESGLRAAAAAVGGQDVRARITVLRLDDEGGFECFVQAVPYTPLSADRYEAGVGAVVTDVRLEGAGTWTRYKLGNRIAFRLAQQQACRRGAWEGLLLSGDGFVADGAISNVHFVRDGRVFAPSIEAGALPGVARAAARQIAEQLHIPWREGRYTPAEFRRADECFLTNALVGVLPVTVLDGQAVGSGEPGPVTRRLMVGYEEKRGKESRFLWHGGRGQGGPGRETKGTLQAP